MDEYLIYLRKSRKDRDLELTTGVTDTLERHRRALLELADRMRLTISGIFEEVVSGDTIAERPEMQKLLAAVETGRYAGVLVMEVPRLARGNTRDQGTVAETFQYSNTKIITPDKIYDPSDESDEEYFEFGLFLSRREYKAINRRLQRGRMASLKEGKYIGGTAPYGYEKYKLPKQRGYSLRIIPGEAETVRHIYALYTTGSPQPDGTCRPVGSCTISNLLNTEGTPAPSGGKWSASSVRDILQNPAYAGYTRWSYRPSTRKMVNGQVVESHPVSKDAMVTKGIHKPIISQETFQTAQSFLHTQRHTPVPRGKATANPLAGLLFCSVCGRSLIQLPHGSKAGPILMCPTPGCPTVSSRTDLVERALLDCLRQWLTGYELDRGAVDWIRTGPSSDEAERNLSRLEAARDSLSRQRSRLCSLLEQGIYTEELFLQRSRLLASQAAELESALAAARENLKAQQAANGRAPFVPKLRGLLDQYDRLRNPAQKNALLKEVLDHAVYFKSAGGRWAESDLTLYLFPRVTLPADHL